MQARSIRLRTFRRENENFLTSSNVPGETVPFSKDEKSPPSKFTIVLVKKRLLLSRNHLARAARLLLLRLSTTRSPNSSSSPFSVVFQTPSASMRARVSAERPRVSRSSLASVRSSRLKFQ
jgi:hypothetical protein